MNDPNPPAHKYRVAYDIRGLGEGMTKAELQADPELEDYGATDNFILISIIESESGCRSVRSSSSDGEGNELPAVAMFDCLVHIARDLAISGELDKGREGVCWQLWNAQLEAMELPAQDLEEVREKFGHAARQVN